MLNWPGQEGRGERESSALLLHHWCVGELAHVSAGVHNAKGKLAGRLLGDIRVEVEAEDGLVQLAVAQHVEEGGSRLQIADLREAQSLRSAHLNLSMPTKHNQ